MFGRGSGTQQVALPLAEVVCEFVSEKWERLIPELYGPNWKGFVLGKYQHISYVDWSGPGRFSGQSLM